MTTNKKQLQKDYAVECQVLYIITLVEFALYVDYTRRLEFEQEPDYDYLRHLFYSVMDKNNFEFDNEFDWMLSDEFRNSFSSYKKKPNKEEVKNYFDDEPCTNNHNLF